MGKAPKDAVVLHQYPGVPGQESLSNFCVKVHRMLAFKGLDYDVQDAFFPRTVARVNPTARKLPVVDLYGDRVADSTRIGDALDAHTPMPPFWPSDARDRALAMALEDWADESLYWFMVYYRWTDDEAFRRFIPHGFSAVFSLGRKPLALVLRREMRHSLHAQGLGRLTMKQADALFERHLDSIDALVADGGWLVGDAPTLADISVFAMLHGLQLESMTHSRALINQRQALCEWARRVDVLTRNRHTCDWC